jgi:hypothetical protein
MVYPLTGAVVTCPISPAKKASTAFAADSFVEVVTSKAQPATSATNVIKGINIKAVAATDADYALSVPLTVIEPTEDATYLVNVGAGTLASAALDVRYPLFDAVSVDLSAPGTGPLTLVGKQGVFAVCKVNGVEVYLSANES